MNRVEAMDDRTKEMIFKVAELALSSEYGVDEATYLAMCELMETADPVRAAKLENKTDATDGWFYNKS